MHNPSLFSNLGKHLSALAIVGAVTSIFFTVREALDITLIALLYLIPLGMITAFWGLGPGLASAALSFLTLNYFFIQPYYMLAVHQPADVIILVIFLVVAVVISQLVGRMQAGLAAANAREREATQLYELSTALAGLHDERSIVRVLARQIQSLSQGGCVEVRLISGQSVHVPEIEMPFNQADLTLPIESARGMLGEIKLWKTETAIASEERRLLRTFASQGALALERAGLVEAESRAKVLEESDRLKSALLSSVSHELRTPLATIKAAASSLRGGEVGWDSPASVELVAAIDEEADHLNMLVGNLLDMSRIESGALKPKREWNILPEIAGGVLSRMRRLTGEHRIEVDLPDDLPLVPADYVQLEQVFTNLVSNGLKYAPVRSVIRIRAKVEDEMIHVQVSNQGPQVPADDLERIFDKFYRITAADRITGTGLGLSICKGIIEAHGGRIWAENVRDGLAFHFTLPLLWDGASPPKLPMENE
jgi:two-component system sensor histidine kinase KdpD